MRIKIIAALLLSAMISLCSPDAVAHRPHRHNGKSHGCHTPCPARHSDIRCDLHDYTVHLFDGIGLTNKQYRQADKSYTKYLNNMRDIERKMSNADRHHTAVLIKEAQRYEDKFMNEMRRLLNPSQYRIFQNRFSALRSGMLQSAPRPGSPGYGLGPVMEGPNPQLMTKPGY